jgi:hypothetical protein
MALGKAQRQQIAQSFQRRFLAGERFETIVQARQVASDLLGEPVKGGTPLAKATEEAIEQGLVGAAQTLIKQGANRAETFDQLVDLYERQPRLGSRSSTSVLRQQYSTPVPIAYMASELAGIDVSKKVYEPTAGHGALLMGASPENATVNELDDERAAFLKRQGFNVTQNDATQYSPAPRSQDVVMTNPPFGRRRKGGRAERFTIGAEKTPIQTSQLDHVIAWRSLEAMKDDGTAVLLIGSERGQQAQRSDKYNGQQNRGFFKNLYDTYNVTEHFTIDGGLYSRQGAGFPIDVIQIKGRGPAAKRLPAAEVPPVYRSYDELKEVLQDAVLRESPSVGAEPDPRGRDDANAPGQLLRGASAPGQNPDQQLRGLRGTAGRPDRLDDSAVDGRLLDADGGGGSNDSPSSGERRRSGDDRPQRFSGDAAALGQRPGQQLTDEANLDNGNHAGIPDADGPGRGEPSGRDRDGGGADLGGMAPVLHQDGLTPTPTHSRTPTDSTTKEGTMATTTEQQQQSGQVPYVPRSGGPRLETLIPRNMASAVQGALDDLEGRVGDLDEFVTQKLNYSSVEAMHEVLAAEQVDGVALGIDSIERGDGALVGDQTGVGKGRQMAAMIRYAKETDRTPIFVTRDAGLYADMIRDLNDVGVKDFKPFLTNSSEKVPLPDGRTLQTKRDSHGAELDRLLQQGGFSTEDEYDGIFTTYSQMQTVRGKNTPRREFLDMMAPQSLMVMDEAHEAGGSPQNESWQSQNQPPNRAEYARGLVDKSDGVTFSSATAVKRPDVMDLYGRRSGMKAALGSVEALQETLINGGIPLQQTATNMLAGDGFYIRRERSYEGVDFGIKTVSVDRDSTDGLSHIMGNILRFDRAKQDALAGLDNQLKAAAKKVGTDTSVGKAGADSVNFTAIMHNVMDQAALGRKADQMANEAIASLENGEKPILTVSNTMGSFIENYADDNNIAPGDAFDATFGDVLRRYLERSRDVIEKDYDGTGERRRLSDEELGPEAVAAYNEAAELIETSDLDFPISPIDYIKQRVEEAGYSFGEITGRGARLEYDGEGNTTYQRRSAKETSKEAKVKATDGFNSGKTDVLLLNRSGATGISLHASEKFDDQRRRHMIVGQAERNINDFMQTLGRAHRTGQVVAPRISLLMGDTPDEKRPAALLNNKMASLNANTTADKNAGFDTSQIPDFFNQYGDAVVEQVLSEYPEINEKLDFPITVSPDGIASLDDAEEGAIAKVTGRLPLLSVEEQEAFYGILEEEYASFVNQQKALGNNVLEAEAVDLDARTLAQAEVIPAKAGMRSTFASGVSADVVDVKAQSKPKTQLEVINEVRTNLGLGAVDAVEDHDFAATDEQSQAYASSFLEKAGQAADKYLAQQRDKIERNIQDPEKRQTALNRESRRVGKQRDQLTQIKRFRVGQTVRLSTDQGRIFYGAVSGINKRGRSLDAMLQDAEPAQGGLGDTNPVAPSRWEVRVSLADASREIPIPLSKVNTDRMGSVEMTPVQKTMMGEDVMGQFDARQTGSREVRQVLRGNLLRAAEKYGKKGNVINATTAKGGVEPMLLLPKGYDLQQELAEAPVALPEAQNIQQFMEVTSREGIVKTSNEQITLKAAPNSQNYLLQTGKKQKGVFLDEDLLEALGDEFYSVSDRMEASFPPERLEDVVSYIQNGRNQPLEAVTHLDQARELVGEAIPEFAWSDSVEEVIEKAGLPPSISEMSPSDLDAVRDQLEALYEQDDEAPSEPSIAELQDELPIDPDQPIGIERVELEGSPDGPVAGGGDGPPDGGDGSDGPEDENPGNLGDLVAQVKSAVDEGDRFNFTVEMPGRGDRSPRSLNMAVANSEQIRLNDEADGVEIASSTDLGRFFNAPQFEAEALESLGLDKLGAEPDVDRLGAQVQQAKDLADDGMVMRFEVDVDPDTPDIETSLEPQDNGRPQFDLFDADAIRLQDGKAQLQVGIDSSGDSLEDLWVDIPDADTQLDTAIAEARPLEPQQEEPDAAYRIDPDGPTTIGRERARLLNSAPDLSEYSSDQDIQRANDIAARDDELEALAEDHGDDAAISFTDPAEQEVAISAQDVRYPGQPEPESPQLSAEDVFELRPDIFRAQPDSVLDDDPEMVYQDGERDFIRVEGQLYSYQKDDLFDALKDLAEAPAVEPEPEAITEAPEAATEASDEPEPESVARVGGWKDQRGRAAQNVGKLLEAVGLSEAVMADEEFYLKVENEPFTPLNIERHGEQLMLYHTQVEGGDAYIESEMVFTLDDDGSLELAETATQSPGLGESRGKDNSFAVMFSSNLRKQGFAEAAAKARAPEPEIEADAGPQADAEPSEVVPEAQAVEAPDEIWAEQPQPEVEPVDVPTAVQDGVESPADESPPFDYHDTLDHLREQVASLPDDQQGRLMQAIQQTETQLNGEAVEPAPETEPVPAGEFVQSAIAQQDPDLDEQLVAPSEDDSPTVEAFRDWYRAARSLGRSEQGLKQIETLGKAAKAGTLDGLEADAAEQMDSDLDTFAQQQAIGQSVLTNARRFLSNLEAAGLAERDEQNAIQATGQIYTVRETQQGFGVIRNDKSAGVVANEKGEITQVTGLTEDDLENWQRSGEKTSDKLRAEARLEDSYKQLSGPQRRTSSGVEL